MAPRLVIWHIEALPDTSLTAAFERGGWEFAGWGQDRHLLADIYDAQQINTELTGQWKETPDLGRWPRPTNRAPDPSEPKKKVSVKELYGRLKSQAGALAGRA